MVWVIIALVLLVAFGPVLWLVPSKRDKRLAAMRQQATRSGLVVDLARLPNLNPAPDERVTAGGQVKQPVIECTAYRLVLGRALKRLPAWRAQRDGGRGGAGGVRDPALAVTEWADPWVYEMDRRPTGAAKPVAHLAAEGLAPLIAELPGDVIGVEFGPRELVAYLKERPGSDAKTVGALVTLLKAMEQSLSALDARLESEGARGRSALEDGTESDPESGSD